MISAAVTCHPFRTHYTRLARPVDPRFGSPRAAPLPPPVTAASGRPPAGRAWSLRPGRTPSARMQSVTTHPAPTVTSSQSTDSLQTRRRVHDAAETERHGRLPLVGAHGTCGRQVGGRGADVVKASHHVMRRHLSRAGQQRVIEPPDRRGRDAVWQRVEHRGVGDLDSDEVRRVARVAGPGESGHPSSGVREHATVPLRSRVRCHGEGHPGIPGEMGVEQGPEVDVAQRVAVDEKETIVQQRQRPARPAGRPEQHVLPGVADGTV